MMRLPIRARRRIPDFAKSNHDSRVLAQLDASRNLPIVRGWRAAMGSLRMRIALPGDRAARDLHALVVASGAGRGPGLLTRRHFSDFVPKQFCRVGSDRSLLEETVE